MISEKSWETSKAAARDTYAQFDNAKDSQQKVTR